MSSLSSTTQATLRADEASLWHWLRDRGLRFDPFAVLNAAEDPHLSQYLVGHEQFAHVWGDWIAWLFAPAGGGKTAMRVRTTRACWVGQAPNRPFPIPYNPPYLRWERLPPSWDDHLLALGRAGARALLMTLAYRPHWFMNLQGEDRRVLRRALAWNLPGPLSTYVELCRETGSLTQVRRALNLGPAFALPDPPKPDTLREWCRAIEATPSAEDRPESAATRWEALLAALLDTLHVRSLYILLDGLDAVPETYLDADNVVAVLDPWIPHLFTWAEQGIYVKGFLPLATHRTLQQRCPEAFAAQRCAFLTWSPALLSEVVRRRVYVASEGAFGSLDAIASPGLRDVETLLAEAVEPLPREMLVLTRDMLQFHLRRAGREGYLEEKDIEQAIERYQHNRGGTPAYQGE
ncbi:MAG: hypothetical protein ACP5HM_03785 [Anaerolineae bacterium]